MGALPVILPVGVVAVYGNGFDTPTPQNIINPPGTLWGSIYDLWDGGRTYMYIGDTVTFKESNIIARLAIGSGHYTIVPARLVTKENPVV